MNTNLGLVIKDELCEDCKVKIRKLTEELQNKPYLIVAYKRIAKKFFSSLCSSCKEKVKLKMGVK